MISNSGPSISVIVPAYNAGQVLGRCLGALMSSRAAEIIVVDDASTDDSAVVAARMGARVLALAANAGPAMARNHAARHARGDVLLFVDADVVVAPGTVDRVAAVLGAHPELAAIFGSYDADPPATGIVSRYKNLLHHFVHQTGASQASTFWAGCGAIRRNIFEKIGGFDGARFRRASIEDIELGCRLRDAGYPILLDPTLQATHLKRWTLRGLLWTDIVDRALPWSRLLVDGRVLINDLNLRRDQRVSAYLLAVAGAGLALTPVRPWLSAVSAGALLGVIALNWRLYRFFAVRGGIGFAVVATLLHWLYYLYSASTYLGVWASARLRSLVRFAWTRPTPAARDESR